MFHIRYDMHDVQGKSGCTHVSSVFIHLPSLVAHLKKMCFEKTKKVRNSIFVRLLSSNVEGMNPVDVYMSGDNFPLSLNYSCLHILFY